LASLLGVSHDTVQRSLDRIEATGKFLISRSVGQRNSYFFPDVATRTNAAGENRATTTQLVPHVLCGPTNYTQHHTQIESRNKEEPREPVKQEEQELKQGAAAAAATRVRHTVGKEEWNAMVGIAEALNVGTGDKRVRGLLRRIFDTTDDRLPVKKRLLRFLFELSYAVDCHDALRSASDRHRSRSVCFAALNSLRSRQHDDLDDAAMEDFAAAVKVCHEDEMPEFGDEEAQGF